MEGQTIANRKRTRGQTIIYKTLHTHLNIEQHEPNKNRDELLSSER
jgi:hypothetical protein